MRSKTLIGKLVLLAALTILATGAMASEPTSFDEALAQAKAENKMLVIDFYTDW